ncbi:MAG: glycosyltransferase [Alphaproteobacteria bacterium]|jgi:glycosyltransferase involved in cell wall biosynthesis|nr:glycosyltransferase [Alphaproteobacteria bacterium]
MPPSILFVNRVYPPDPGATGQVLADLAAWLSAAGWAVTVIAGSRTGRADTGMTPDGVRLVRTPMPGGRSMRAGLAQLAGLSRAALAVPVPDIAVTMTDPPMLALLGPWLRHRGAATLHWCQDLYPALLPVLAVRRPPPALLTGLSWLAIRALNDHDRVLATGRCMAARMAGLGVSRERLATRPNWPDPLIRADDPGAAAVRSDLGLEGRFLALYSGNFGRGHVFDGMLEAAAILQAAGSPVVFGLAGDGSRRAAVEADVARRRLGNVRLLPRRDRSGLSAALGAADVHLASLTEAAAGLMIPSKVYGALASGRPCLFLGPEESEAARLIVEGGCGAVLPADDGAGLAARLAALAADPAHCRTLGSRAVAAVAPWRLERGAAAFSALALEAVEARSRRSPARPALPADPAQALHRGDGA